MGFSISFSSNTFGSFLFASNFITLLSAGTISSFLISFWVFGADLTTVPPSADTEPNNAPTSTTDPSCEFISVNTPEIGDGTSKFTLSVSSSTIGSSASTVSPAFFNHFATVASVILSPRTGTTIFSLIKINQIPC